MGVVMEKTMLTIYNYNSFDFEPYCTGKCFLVLVELYSFICYPTFFSYCRILEARVKLKNKFIFNFYTSFYKGSIYSSH